MVVCQIDILKNRGQFELIGGNFIVACFGRDTQTVTFQFQFFHEIGDTGRYGAEIVVIQLLVFGRRMSHQGAAGETQVGACVIKYGVYQKIFLFPTQICIHAFYIRVKHLANFGCCFVHCTECFQQRCFIVKCFACIGYENSGDTQCAVYNKSRRRNVPCRIAACFECISDSAIRER